VLGSENSPGNAGQVEAIFCVGDFRSRHNKGSCQIADVCVVQDPAALGREERREEGGEGGREGVKEQH